MDEQLALFNDLEDSFSIDGLFDKCYVATKKRYPRAMECESQDDYINFVNDEAELLYASQLKDIAQRIEDRIYSKQKSEIDSIYGLTFDDSLDNI